MTYKNAIIIIFTVKNKNSEFERATMNKKTTDEAYFKC